MIREVDIKVVPEKSTNRAYLKQYLEGHHLFPGDELLDFKLLKRSIDARGREPYYQLRFRLFINEFPSSESTISTQYKDVSASPVVAIIGAGPAGYFAALELISLGLKPVIFDRGKDVQLRRRDLKAIQQLGIVNPDSNYCFGEGGAGTYSDGKLYTRAKKRGDIEKVAKIFVEHGAQEDILIDAHPHIGSNKLPGILANMRQTILQSGGEVHFDHRLTDIKVENGKLKSVTFQNGREENFENLILATGHSARDIYELLDRKGIEIEAKPFALGVRVEHPQTLIDQIQYNREQRGEHLPAASYALSCQIGDQGVFSFCMCPGGLIVPAATSPGEIVVNGMSLSRRDSPFANSGVVVSVDPSKMPEYKHFGVFAGVEFQKAVEQRMFNYGDGSQKAPAQRLTDFVRGSMSANVNDSSYIPGLVSAPLHELLPREIYRSISAGLKKFGGMMTGYYTAEANVVGTESRTSAPVKIPRNPATYMHPNVVGLYPCGEGAGYAGGIMSAAMDGQRVAAAIADVLKPHK